MSKIGGAAAPMVRGIVNLSTVAIATAIAVAASPVALADAQDQIDAAGVADEVDLSALNAAAQSLDDIVPDAVEVTDEVPPAEVTDEVPAEVTDEVPAEVDAPVES